MQYLLKLSCFLLILCVSLFSLSGCQTTPLEQGSSVPSSKPLPQVSSSAAGLPAQSEPEPAAADSIFLKGKEQEVLSVKEAWGDGCPVLYLDNFLQKYHFIGDAPIRDNGDLPVVSPEERPTLLLYNVLTGIETPILQAEEGSAFGYSGGDDRYLIAYQYDAASPMMYTTPTSFVIYDILQEEATVILDLTVYQSDDTGKQYLYPLVSLYDGAMYFELQDRVMEQDADGFITDYGLSTYRYLFETGELEKIRERAASPVMTDEGLYFMDKSSDLEGGSVYFQENGQEEAVELIPNCNEFVYSKPESFFTKDIDGYQLVFSFSQGKEKELFSLNGLNKGWNYLCNGRMLCWSRTGSPLYVYDMRLQKVVQVSDAAGAHTGVPSAKYLYWNEITDESAPKGEEPNRLCVMDISSLMIGEPHTEA